MKVEMSQKRFLVLSTLALIGGGALFLYLFYRKPERKKLSLRQEEGAKASRSEKVSRQTQAKAKKNKAQPKKSEKKKKKQGKKPVSPMKVDMKKKEIRVPGVVTIRYGLIEVFACTIRGKRHESIFTIDCDPKMLQFYLLAFGLKPNNPLQYFGQGGKLEGDLVYIYVRWKDPKTKKWVIYRGEDLVYNIKTKKTMRRSGWVFTGSKFEKYTYKTPEGKTITKEVFLASYAGNLVTTYHDPAAILNNPMETGGDDTLYYANYLALPPRGYPVELIFTVREVPEWDRQSRPYDATKQSVSKKPKISKGAK